MKKIIKDFIKACDLCLNNPIYRPRDGFVSWNNVWKYKISLDCINSSYTISYNWVSVIDEETYDDFIVRVRTKLDLIKLQSNLNCW
jgi:hypothetical protein